MKKGVRVTRLIASIFAILIAFAMVVGTSFAWFTDTTTSSGNKIESGTLKIGLELLEDDGSWNSIKEQSAPIFNNPKLEPNCAEVKIFKVINDGTLDIKWQATLSAQEDLGALAEIVDVFILAKTNEEIAYPENGDLSDYTYAGTLAEFINNYKTKGELLEGEWACYAVALKMQDVGNEYQGLVLESSFDIKIQATQRSDDAEFEVIVARGIEGGVDWKLSETGKLTISSAVDDDGSWREAVIYDANGSPVAIGGYPYDVNAVTSIVIEEGVTSIGSFTSKFPNATGEVVIPASVTYIGQEAFQNVPITKLTFAPGGTEPLCIAPGAFKSLAVTEIVLPADRPEIHIHCWAFNGCNKLESITFPANVTTFSGWTHVDYCGMDYVEGKYRTASDILSKCSSLKKITFGSQEVHDLFFNANSNRGTVNAIGNVEIVIE